MLIAVSLLKKNSLYIYMKIIYISIYIIICVIIFMIVFMSGDTFNFLFEKKINNITDYNDPNYTGGVEYIFNPFQH